MEFDVDRESIEWKELVAKRWCCMSDRANLGEYFLCRRVGDEQCRVD